MSNPAKKEYKVSTFFDCPYKLNDQQEAFARFYCSHAAFRDEELAFELAGYKVDEGDETKNRYKRNQRIKALMEHKEIRDYIDDLMAERDKNPQVDKSWILIKLKRIVMANDKSPTLQLKALDLLARAIGMYNENNQEREGEDGDAADLAMSAYKKRATAFSLLELRNEVRKEGGADGNTGQGVDNSATN